MAQRTMAAAGAPVAAPEPKGPPPIPNVDWYYAVGSERRGPIDLSSLEALVSGGSVSASTLLWRSGMKDWAPAFQVDEMKAPLAAKTARA